MSVFLCGHLPRGLAEFPSKFLPAQAGPAGAGSSTWWSFRLASVSAVAVTPGLMRFCLKEGSPLPAKKLARGSSGNRLVSQIPTVS